MTSAPTAIGHADPATPQRAQEPEPAAECSSEAPPEIEDYAPGGGRGTVTRIFCNGYVAIYGDAGFQALPAARKDWVPEFMTELWQYEKETYGDCATTPLLLAPVGSRCEDFGGAKPLMVILGSELGNTEENSTDGSGTIYKRFNKESGYRDTIFVNSKNWNSKSIMTDVISHESCHIVEGSGQGIEDSPAFAVWGDSQWAPYCQLDFYTNTGRTADADRIYKTFEARRDNNPSGAKQAAWMRDWFLPMWIEGDRTAATMEKYFGLVAQYFPTTEQNDGRSLKYSRYMNAGEYVLFASAAAGVDLSPRAAQAFNSGFDRAQFDQARRDFPEVSYPTAPCVEGVAPCAVVPVDPVGATAATTTEPVSVQIEATGANLRYLAQGLPDGMTIDSASGLITGTPKVTGRAYTQVTVTGDGANPGQTTFSWDVIDWVGELRDVNGQCADRRGGGGQDGNQLQAYGCNGTNAQLFTKTGGEITVGGNCITPGPDGSGAKPSIVTTTTCDGTDPAQKWTIDGSTRTVRHDATDRCLTTAAVDSSLTLTTCSDSDSAEQKWQTPVTDLGDAGSTPIEVAPVDWNGELVDSAGLCVDNASSAMTDGNPVQAWGCNDTSAQLIESSGDRIRVQGRCLTPEPGATGDALPIVIRTCDASKPEQEWTVDRDGGTVRSTASDTCLQSEGLGSQLTAGTCSGAEQQRWSIPALIATGR